MDRGNERGGGVEGWRGSMDIRKERKSVFLCTAACENALSDAVTERKQAEMRLKSAQSELKEKEQTSKSNNQAYSKDKETYAAMVKEIGRIEVYVYSFKFINAVRWLVLLQCG